MTRARKGVPWESQPEGGGFWASRSSHQERRWAKDRMLLSTHLDSDGGEDDRLLLVKVSLVVEKGRRFKGPPESKITQRLAYHQYR